MEKVHLARPQLSTYLKSQFLMQIKLDKSGKKLSTRFWIRAIQNNQSSQQTKLTLKLTLQR